MIITVVIIIITIVTSQDKPAIISQDRITKIKVIIILIIKALAGHII